ncbi:MAG: flagellar basal body P-ring formation chaperone FlgA [Ramlibacter sp.]
MTTRPVRFRRAALLALLAAACAAAAGAPLDPKARAAIEDFLLAQAAGAPGQVTVRVQNPTGALRACTALQPFLPRGVAAWGRLSVGVRCADERPWTRFLSAQVAVQGKYLAAARAIGAGQALGAADVLERSGDLTTLPRTVLTDPALAAGMVAANPIAPGAPLRSDLLRAPVVIRQGQVVRVVTEGAGFTLATEGRAVTQAAAGTAVQVRTAAGRLLTGTARPDGSVGL